MEQTDMKQIELANILGVGRSAVSMIMSGDRPITAEHARALGKRFCVDPGLFL
jgi:plasmid maintenance system antidote protein VapI